MNKSLLSVCCVSYNHSSYIERCIQSIWNQDYKNIEILALDDGSSDDSVQVLSRLKERSPVPMNVYSQANTGNIGANFNKLLKKAAGKYVMLIACDDFFITNTFAKKISFLEGNEALGFVCESSIKVVDENDKIIEKYPELKLNSIENPSISDILELDYSQFGAYYIQGAVYRKSIIDEIGGFDEDMICDDIVLRTKYARYLLKNKEQTCLVLKEPGVYYRRHSSNISSNSTRQVKGVIEYLNRYWNYREPPAVLYKWIKGAIVSSGNPYTINDIFFKNNYILKIFKHFNLYNLLDENGICYYKKGIPGVFTISKHRKPLRKIRVIKIFNIPVFKWEKRTKDGL